MAMLTENKADYQYSPPEVQPVAPNGTVTQHAEVEKKPPSRADSVLSAEVSDSDSTSDQREERTALWTKNINVQLEGPKIASVPIKRSNTPMRRILERQVSSSSERGLWRR